MRLYAETLCPHDFLDEHYICDEWSNERWREATHSDDICLCPGGVRIEINVERLRLMADLAAVSDISTDQAVDAFWQAAIGGGVDQ